MTKKRKEKMHTFCHKNKQIFSLNNNRWFEVSIYQRGHYLNPPIMNDEILHIYHFKEYYYYTINLHIFIYNHHSNNLKQVLLKPMEMLDLDNLVGLNGLIWFVPWKLKRNNHKGETFFRSCQKRRLSSLSLSLHQCPTTTLCNPSLRSWGLWQLGFVPNSASYSTNPFTLLLKTLTLWFLPPLRVQTHLTKTMATPIFPNLTTS